VSHKDDLMQWIDEQVAHVPDRGVTEFALKVFNQIDAEMKRQGMTQTALAEAAGVNRAFVSRILNNPSNVTLGTIMRLANALDLDVEAPKLTPRAPAFERLSLTTLLQARDAGGDTGVEELAANAA